MGRKAAHSLLRAEAAGETVEPVQERQPARHVPQHLHPAARRQPRQPRPPRARPRRPAAAGRAIETLGEGAALGEGEDEAGGGAVDAVADELDEVRVLEGRERADLGDGGDVQVITDLVMSGMRVI